jgi:hypothetical protein
MRTTRWGWAGLALSLVACDSPRSHGDSVLSSVDSAGVRVIEYDLRDDARPLRLAQRPTLSFASQTESFDWIWSFSRSADQRYLILDRSGGVRVFDSEGGKEATLGRFGQGPAEFQDPWRAWWRDDGSVEIYDARGSALLRFSRVYDFEDRTAVPYRYSTGVLPLSSGGTLFIDEHFDSMAVGYGRAYNSVRVVDASGDSTVWTRTTAGDGHMTSTQGQATMGGTHSCPYMHDTLLAAADSLVVTEAAAPRTTLLVSDVDGSVQRILRRPGDPKPPPSSEEVAFSVAEFRYHVSQSEWDHYDPLLCDVGTVAEVSRILPDPSGDLWLARRRTFPAFEARIWDRVTMNGVHSATLTVHPHFRVLEFGEDDVLGVLTTEVGEVLPLVFRIEEG